MDRSYPSFIQRHRDQLIILGSMIFITLVSYFFLMGKSIRLDEAQSVWQTNHSFLGTLHIIATDVHVPVYFILLRGWIMTFGSSVADMRSLSLLFLLMSIPALYKLSKESYSSRIAILTVLLATVSPFLHWYGSEARMYTLLFLITILNHIYFLKLFTPNSSTKNSSWYLYALTVFVGVYTHIFFGLILLVQVLFYAKYDSKFQTNSLRRFSLVVFGVLLETGVWILFRLNTGTANSSPLLHTPTTSDIFNLFSNVYIGLQTNSLNSFFLSLWPIFVLLGFSLLARREKIAPETVYLFGCTFLPILSAFLISIFFRPVFVSRYLIIVVPSLYILTSYLISLYSQKIGNRILAVLILSMVFALGVEVTSAKVPVNENYRQVSAYVEKKAKSNDIFIVSAPFTTYPVEYYYHGRAPLDTFPHWARYESNEGLDGIPPYSEEYLAGESTEWAKHYEYLYLLLSYDQGYEESTRLYLDSHYERVSAKEFSPNLKLYIYKLRYL